MALKKEDYQEVEEVIQQRDSGIAKAIVIGALIIAASNIITSPNFSLRPQSALGPSPAPNVAALASGAPAAAPTAAPKVTVSMGHLPAKGSNNAQVAIIEFADFRCPFCEQFFSQTEPQIIKDYVDTGKVKLTFRHYEFLGAASITAGNAAECANEQGKFWEYYDWLYKNQPPESDTSMYVTDKLTTAATTLGINGSQFKTCLDSTKFAKNLTDDMNEGSTAGVTGTPGFIIGKLDPTGTKIVDGTLVVGAQPYSAFKAALDPLLQ